MSTRDFSDVQTIECPRGGCRDCADMCKETPCFGPPEEMERLLLAGYGDRLSLTLVNGYPALLPAAKGYEGKTDCRTGDRGECTFLDSNGKCELHHLGLKPLTGRVANCEYEPVFISSSNPIGAVTRRIREAWKTERGFDLASEYTRQYLLDTKS